MGYFLRADVFETLLANKIILLDEQTHAGFQIQDKVLDMNVKQISCWLFTLLILAAS